MQHQKSNFPLCKAYFQALPDRMLSFPSLHQEQPSDLVNRTNQRPYLCTALRSPSNLGVGGDCWQAHVLDWIPKNSPMADTLTQRQGQASIELRASEEALISQARSHRAD